MKNKAFTLAEVLITLVIIGVIAALTVPTLLQNKDKQETITGIKKFYSIMNTAIKLSEIDNGDISTWKFEESGWTPNNFLETYITPYLKINTNCIQNDPPRICGWGQIPGLWGLPKYILTDGTIIVENGFTSTSFTLFVDINGLKKPNIYGKDRFVFYIYKNSPYKFLPAGIDPTNPTLPSRNYIMNSGNDGDRCSSDPTSNRIRCTALIFRDNWTIADDYPW